MNNNDINLENKRKNKGELLNVLKMYSPAVIALKDIFFTEKKEKKQKKEKKDIKRYILTDISKK